MQILNRLELGLSVSRQLGFRPTVYYALYQLGLKSGYWRMKTPAPKETGQPLIIQPQSKPHRGPLTMPTQQQLADLLVDNGASLLVEANEIESGKYRPFGGELKTLELCPASPLEHWTYYESHGYGENDIKDIWDPARFAWVYPLGRAYLFTGDERYPQVFWAHLKAFLAGNPLNMGPNWISGQEVALRIMAFSFARQVFAASPSSTPENIHLLDTAIAMHARRIPPTMIYARAQNNNHLIIESVGLYTAGIALPDYPLSADWRRLGWSCLNEALQTQISPDGTYIQHSANYHRLMLHAALWARMLAAQHGDAFTNQSRQRLVMASRWLLAQLDPTSGLLPNLGHNDGSNILPLASGGISDYRPVAQAAGLAFLEEPYLPAGPWDELSLWLGLPVTNNPPSHPTRPNSPAVLRLDRYQTWGTLRAVEFNSRPAHADQLHVELWWKGVNIAMDPGTYRYTAPQPWDNALVHTAVHNTIMVDDSDQMRRAGRFLWLDWAQAIQIVTGDEATTLTAEHYGYKKLGMIHRRALCGIDDLHWQVQDYLFTNRIQNSRHTCSLHWLLPDWPWQWDGPSLLIDSPKGTVSLTVNLDIETCNRQIKVSNTCLVRAGVTVEGKCTNYSNHGWFSPTYGVKIPALSYIIEFEGPLPLSVISDWQFIESLARDVLPIQN
jgi:hypothetical protein